MGWQELQLVTDVTLSYSSSDAPVFVASTSSDLTGTITPGMRLRVSQSTGGLKYFVVVGVTSSTLTLFGGTDFTLNNETISSPVFSGAKIPFGFPADPAKWTIELRSTTTVSQGTATANTWYNLGSLSIDIPIGLWRVYWQASMLCSRASVSAIQQTTTLSTSNNSESDPDLSASIYLGGATGNLETQQTLTREKVLALTSKTTFYFNSKTSISNTNLNISGTPTLIRAVCAYL